MEEKGELELLRRENERLKKEMQAIGENLNNRLKETEENVRKELEKNQNRVLEEKGTFTTTETWTEAMDELAHAIHTSIKIANNSLGELEKSDQLNTAFAHIRQIKNYTDLILWDLHLRKGELLDPSKKRIKIDFIKIIPTVIDSIQSEPSVLRYPNDVRKKQYETMKPTLKFPKKCNVYIAPELIYVFDLLFLELLKNAFMNSDYENPLVKVFIDSDEDYHFVSFLNNKIMLERDRDWLENKVVNSSDDIATSLKVGLRLIKRWSNILCVNIKVSIIENEKTTKIQLQIPKVIKLR